MDEYSARLAGKIMAPAPNWLENKQHSSEETVRKELSEDRMNRTISLPECTCLQTPRIVSYAEVGDPEGIVAFLILGVDSHRYMCWLFEEAARAKGVRLICFDRPGRGYTSDYYEESANRIVEFPEVLRAFCKATGIKYFALLGQSLGATYALRCAQQMPDMVATTVYLISPWVPLSIPGSNRALALTERLPRWLVKGAMQVGTAMPRLLASAGGLRLLRKGCSEAEAALFASESTGQVLKAVANRDEATHGVVLDALAALETDRPLGFDYRDVSMPVHVFHGRTDNMVPFAAVQWMAEEMPACTVSVKMGGTHALIMDKSVMDCVLECMCEDFKHFKAHVANGKREREGGERNASERATVSFPAHTQRFQAEGPLLCLQGMLLKGWKPRYFILEGYELHEFEGPDCAAALHVLDLRGTVARVSAVGGETRANHLGDKMFEFRLQDSKQKTIYDLGASTARERAFWVETLTKASCFSKGSGEQHRHGALSKCFLVTTRPEGRRGVGLGEGAVGRDGGVRRKQGSGALKSRRVSPDAGGRGGRGMHGASLAQVKQQMAAVSSSSYLDQGQALSPPPTTNRESRDHPSAAGARTPGIQAKSLSYCERDVIMGDQHKTATLDLKSMIA